MAASAPGIKIAFFRTIQTRLDSFAALGITEDSTSEYKLDEMANAAGGSGKSLH